MDASADGPLARGRVSYLMTTVRDLATTVRFYRDLGFEDVYVAEGQCAFLRLPGGDGPQLAFYPGRPEEGPGRANWMLVVDVPEIDVAVETLSGAGVGVSAVEDVPFGRAATFTDPDGNVIEVHQRTSD